MLENVICCRELLVRIFLTSYTDDEPDDGPSFYILLAGFNHPHLITQLAEVGVFLDSVIRVDSEEYPKPVVPEPQEEGAPMKDEKTLGVYNYTMCHMLVTTKLSVRTHFYLHFLFRGRVQ